MYNSLGLILSTKPKEGKEGSIGGREGKEGGRGSKEREEEGREKWEEKGGKKLTIVMLGLYTTALLNVLVPSVVW